jgi:hypothetical protein
MNDDLPVLDELERSLIAGCYGAPGSVGERRVRSRPRWPWAAAGLSAAAGVAAAVLAIVLGSGSVEPPAAQALDRTATAAASGTLAVLRPGQYWYTRYVYSMRVPMPIPPKVMPPGPPKLFATVTTDLRQSVETWIGVDGTVRQRTVILADRFASPADRRRWRASPIFRGWRGHVLPVVARAAGSGGVAGFVVGCR